MESDEEYEIEEIEAAEEQQNKADNHVSLDVRMNSLPTPAPPELMPNNHNTGPKGVLSDFDLAKQNLAKKRLMEKLRSEKQTERMANGFKDLSVLANPTEVTDSKQKGNEKNKAKAEDGEEEEEEEEEEEQDEAFQQYKLQRIHAIQNSLPSYGTHNRVDFNELANILKEENEFVNIVVHLYQNNIEACVKVNLAMETLAPQFPHVHFVRIRSDEAIKKYNVAGLPTILVYRNGVLKNSFIRIIDELGINIDATKLAKFLASHNILRLPTGEENAQKLPPNSRTVLK